MDEATRDHWEGANEAPVISGISHDRSQAKISIVGVPDVPGTAARLFSVVAGANANIDMIVQNQPTNERGVASISFTLPLADTRKVLAALDEAKEELGFKKVRTSDNVGILSLIGAGMRSHPGVSAKLFESLANAGINIDMITTSEIRISVVVDVEELDDAVRAVHTAFGLDAEGEAIVYGGTGR